MTNNPRRDESWHYAQGPCFVPDETAILWYDFIPFGIESLANIESIQNPCKRNKNRIVRKVHARANSEEYRRLDIF